MSYNERKHNGERTVAKQVKIWKYYESPFRTESLTPKRVGKMRKQHSLNCGQARCKICGNPRRLWGHITIKEVSQNERYNGMLKEIDLGLYEEEWA